MSSAYDATIRSTLQRVESRPGGLRLGGEQPRPGAGAADATPRGGANWPSRAPLRTSGPNTRGRHPGVTKLRELSRGMESTMPSRIPRNRLTRSTALRGSSMRSR